MRKTKPWLTDWKHSIYILVFEKDVKECSNYRTIAIIFHAGKAMLVVIQQRLLPSMEQEMPDVQAGSEKGEVQEI